MGHSWRQIRALLAGVGVLTATLYLMGLRAGTEGSIPTRPVSRGQLLPGQALARPGIPDMPAGDTRPSEALARAVERAARGALPEPYFLDRAAAARFLDRWQGRLIEGRVRVAMTDQFDAGAENGHRVPVTLWIDDDSRVMGLTGEALFDSTPPGLMLLDVKLEPVKLAVSTWADAAGRVGQASLTRRQPERADSPFYGEFRFTLGDRRYAINAQTGEVIRE